jgi:hypothetical protein
VLFAFCVSFHAAAYLMAPGISPGKFVGALIRNSQILQPEPAFASD